MPLVGDSAFLAASEGLAHRATLSARLQNALPGVPLPFATHAPLTLCTPTERTRSTRTAWAIQAREHSRKASGFKAIRRRRKPSRDGIPLGSERDCASQSRRFDAH